MKKAMMNLLTVLAVILAVYGVLHTGVYLFHTLMDLVGYVIYLGVFAAPMLYFLRKMEKERCEAHIR